MVLAWVSTGLGVCCQRDMFKQLWFQIYWQKDAPIHSNWVQKIAIFSLWDGHIHLQMPSVALIKFLLTIKAGELRQGGKKRENGKRRKRKRKLEKDRTLVRKMKSGRKMGGRIVLKKLMTFLCVSLLLVCLCVYLFVLFYFFIFFSFCLLFVFLLLTTELFWGLPKWKFLHGKSWIHNRKKNWEKCPPPKKKKKKKNVPLTPLT